MPTKKTITLKLNAMEFDALYRSVLQGVISKDKELSEIFLDMSNQLEAQAILFDTEEV